MLLSRFPRVKLGHFPTPLEPLPRLSKFLGGPNIWVKRDDCTGLGFGGNKTRKLEWVMGDAQLKGADVVITQGAVQTNHGRQTAAAAAMMGMKCEVLLECRVQDTDEWYDRSSNVLLNQLFGAKLTRFPGGHDMHAESLKRVEELKAEGKNPYYIVGGASSPIGALGYVNCAHEMLSQFNDAQLQVDAVVHGTGSSGTQAGLVVGMEALRANIPVMGVSVRLPKEPQEKKVADLAEQTWNYMDLQGEFNRNSVLINADYVGDGYGVPAPSTIEAISVTAALEGLLLDPVYSGKGMAGLIGLIRQGYFKENQNIVFLHTGGAPTLFAYQEQLAQNTIFSE